MFAYFRMITNKIKSGMTEMPHDGFYYVITGKQSIERIDPLINFLYANPVFVDQNNKLFPDFVWETTCEKSCKAFHKSAIILNRLHNSQIIESKSCLAYLQLMMKNPTLDTYIATGALEVAFWAERRWSSQSKTLTCDMDRNSFDWWVVKASKGNGGRDVWVFNEENYKRVITELAESDEYVIQRYVKIIPK